MLLAVMAINQYVSYYYYLGKDAVYNFVNSMIEESKYQSQVMNKYFNNELVMIKVLRTLKYVKVRDNCHITGKHRGSVISLENIEALCIEIVISI